MRRTGRDYLKITSITIFMLILAAYFVFNFRIFIAGPEIIITAPQNGEVSVNELIDVGGKVINSNFISINDRPILVNEQGNFKEFLLLSPGYNIIVIKARDKFKREISKKIEVVYNGDSKTREDLGNLEGGLATSTATSTEAATSPGDVSTSSATTTVP